MQPDEKDLRQRTKEFGLQILSMFSGLPKTTEAQVLGKQVLRSGTSVGANYREAYRARSRAEWSEWGERSGSCRTARVAGVSREANE
jgi:23S rRNA-intervening sequence protein